ncbi:MAG: FAD-dependent oxidoreductase [Lewinellaceae bacterium]|nr:FAD-dependent oxidoreductase [Lewinellaceae bacterium]
MQQVIILGAGLSGLTTAYELKKMGIRPVVLEARGRYGGRIWTLEGEGRATPLEMGATWFGEKHQHLMGMLLELGVGYFDQYSQGKALLESMSFAPPQHFDLSASEEPYHRVLGGSRSLIEALVSRIGKENIRLNTPIQEVREQKEGLKLTAVDGSEYQARLVVSTLPPRLLVKTVRFSPALPKKLVKLMGQTHTWMSESVKFAVEYERPFWREHGFAGTAFSQAGPATEIYDHTNFDGTAFALKGFLSPGTAQLKEDDRREMVLRQLVKLFGLEAANFLSYIDWVWANEVYTHQPYDSYILPHQNSGHPDFALPLMNGKLFLSGTETSPEFGGYMDGAVLSGLLAADRVALL